MRVRSYAVDVTGKALRLLQSSMLSTNKCRLVLPIQNIAQFVGISVSQLQSRAMGDLDYVSCLTACCSLFVVTLGAMIPNLLSVCVLIRFQVFNFPVNN